MPEYADIYAISEHRTEFAITHFLDSFVPSRIEAADEYEIPQYSDAPTTVYKNAGDIIRHCCANRKEVHAVYWRSNSHCEYAMIFFLDDEGLILGISTPAENADRVDQIARALERHIDSDDVFITYEDTPPQSIQAFRSLLRSLDPNPDESARGTRVHRRIKGKQSDPTEPPIPQNSKSSL